MVAPAFGEQVHLCGEAQPLRLAPPYVLASPPFPSAPAPTHPVLHSQAMPGSLMGGPARPFSPWDRVLPPTDQSQEHGSPGPNSRSSLQMQDEAISGRTWWWRTENKHRGPQEGLHTVRRTCAWPRHPTRQGQCIRASSRTEASRPMNTAGRGHEKQACSPQDTRYKDSGNNWLESIRIYPVLALPEINAYMAVERSLYPDVQ